MSHGISSQAQNLLFAATHFCGILQNLMKWLVINAVIFLHVFEDRPQKLSALVKM